MKESIKNHGIKLDKPLIDNQYINMPALLFPPIFAKYWEDERRLA